MSTVTCGVKFLHVFQNLLSFHPSKSTLHSFMQDILYILYTYSHSHTYSHLPCFGMWEETRDPIGNPLICRENMQNSMDVGPVWQLLYPLQFTVTVSTGYYIFLYYFQILSHLKIQGFYFTILRFQCLRAPSLKLVNPQHC